MRAMRKPDHANSVRELQCGTPLLMVDLTDYLTLTFDYNFGSGSKDLLFGVIVAYDSGDDITNLVSS